MINNLLAELGKWMKAHGNVFKTFGFLSAQTSMSTYQIDYKAQSLVSKYSDDLKDAVVAELIHFVAFMRTQELVGVNH